MLSDRQNRFRSVRFLGHCGYSQLPDLAEPQSLSINGSKTAIYHCCISFFCDDPGNGENCQQRINPSAPIQTLSVRVPLVPGGYRERVGRPTRPMSTNSLPMEPRRPAPALFDASGDRFKNLMKRAEDAAEDFRAQAVSLLFGLFAMIAVLIFVGSVIASLTLRRDKRRVHHHAAG
jgi:hypothetical protein